MKYPLIVFDWDGTIIDSAGTIAECIQQAGARDGAAGAARTSVRGT